MALPTGVCSICLEEASLTKEHVPPAGAFNKETVIAFEIEQGLKIEPWDPRPWAKKGGIRGTAMNRGAGFNRLCAKCNNGLCAEYAEEYGNWTRQADVFFRRIPDDLTACPIFFGHPLRFMKQIVAMMLVIGGPEFTQRNPDLRRFVREKSQRFIGHGVRVYAYYNTSLTKGRSGTNIVKGDGATLEEAIHGGFSDPNLYSRFSEVTRYPFGFVLTRHSKPPDARLKDITYLAQYRYDEFTAAFLFLPFFPVVTAMCGDYLTPDEAWLASRVETGPDFFGINPACGDAQTTEGIDAIQIENSPIGIAEIQGEDGNLPVT
jgi:hypothetical protein